MKILRSEIINQEDLLIQDSLCVNVKGDLENINYNDKRLPSTNLQNKNNVALFAGAGSGIGDCLAIYTILPIIELFYNIKKITLIAPYTHLLNHKNIFNNTKYDILTNPIPLKIFNEFDAYFAFENFAIDPLFTQMNWVDYFLFKTNILNVLSKDKQIKLPWNLKEYKWIKKQIKKRNKYRRPLLYFCWEASFPRCLITKKIIELIKFFVDQGYTIISASKETNNIDHILNMLPLKCLKCCINASDLSDNIKDIAFILSCVSACITVDTSILHIAGALNIPTVGVFTSIEPENRIKYLPTVIGYLVPGFKHTIFWGYNNMEFNNSQNANLIYDLYDEIMESINVFYINKLLNLLI